jgi:hypothetical protein
MKAGDGRWRPEVTEEVQKVAVKPEQTERKSDVLLQRCWPNLTVYR